MKAIVFALLALVSVVPGVASTGLSDEIPQAPLADEPLQAPVTAPRTLPL